MKMQIVLLGLLAACALSASADAFRRISLDGKEGVAAPAEEPGKDKINRIHKVETPQLIVFPTAKKPSHGTIMSPPAAATVSASSSPCPTP